MRLFRGAALALTLAGGLLAGCATDPESARLAHHSTAPRGVVLHHPESGETVSVTYWTGRAYDPAALDAINTLFRDRRTQEVMPVDPALIDYVADLRDRLELPADTPINLTSCYRSPFTNASLSRTNANVAENSYHIRGQAADLHIPGVPLERIAEVAAAMQRGGYALYDSHVHVDTGPYRTWTPRRGAAAWLEARARATRNGGTRAVLAAAPPDATAKTRAKAPVTGTAAKTQVARATPAAKPAAKPVKVAQAKPVKVTQAKAAPSPPKPPVTRTKVVVAHLSAKDSRAVKTTK